VLLVLYTYVLACRPQAITLPRRKIPTCYVTPPHTFEEIDSFVTECAGYYNLDIERIALPMQKAFEKFLENRPLVKAVLVGTRRTDPHGENLGHFDPTDHSWPVFMRVQPVIDWHYGQVWQVSGIAFCTNCSLLDSLEYHIASCMIWGLLL
jgi:FAD synthetase